jgi:hypothetical protein
MRLPLAEHLAACLNGLPAHTLAEIGQVPGEFVEGRGEPERHLLAVLRSVVVSLPKSWL